MADKPLTPKQQAFVAAYVGEANGNATEAARRAGYTGSDATLGVTGHNLLKVPKVLRCLETYHNELARLSAETRGEVIASAAKVAERLTAIGMGKATEKRIITGKEGDFIEVDVTMPGTTQVAALKALNQQMGYDSPTKTEVTGALDVDVALSPEMEGALAMWLRYRQDPVIAARIAELEAE